MVNRYLRYSDLLARGIVRNRTGLRDLIENHDFPPGIMLSPNVRGFEESLVVEWLQSRPTAGPALRGAAKAKAEAKVVTA
jgi:predicted DNA-binding transcriptional regulator AlpA